MKSDGIGRLYLTFYLQNELPSARGCFRSNRLHLGVIHVALSNYLDIMAEFTTQEMRLKRVEVSITRIRKRLFYDGPKNVNMAQAI